MCLSQKNSKMAVLFTRDFTEWRKIGLLEESVAQLSSKHNKYQVSFI